MRLLFNKVKSRMWNEMVIHTRKMWFYPFLYSSYWRSLMISNNRAENNTNGYFTARPDPGAGIGHQMANWIAGYWWAKQLGLRFAHLPFSAPQWELFLGFGEGEVSVKELVVQKFRKVKLPLFGQNDPVELNRTKQIIKSYAGKKVVFICEQNQGYMEQYGVIRDIQRKFFSAPARSENKLIYSSDCFNIAIHVRRGDIATGKSNGNDNITMRWQGNDYFTNVLSNVLNTVVTEKPFAIYLFSQGSESDYKEFKDFPNLTFCLDMDTRDSFLHMVMADLLITSKSSFSYKPALLNIGIKVCPQAFWHGYPASKDWILADDNGNFTCKEFQLKK